MLAALGFNQFVDRTKWKIVKMLHAHSSRWGMGKGEANDRLWASAINVHRIFVNEWGHLVILLYTENKQFCVQNIG